MRQVLSTLALALAVTAAAKTPVIYATDKGDDVDDAWALGLLLKCPELDVKLVVGEYGKPQFRTKLLAKFLQSVGRTDIPIGQSLDIGIPDEGRIGDWVKDFDLKAYTGRVYTDGVQAIVDAVMKSRRTVTVICVGPSTTLAAALEREPRIAGRAKLVGMFGSVRLGYCGNPTPCPEYNVVSAVPAVRRVLSAPWKDVTITPLDTCGLVGLDGARYRRVRESASPTAKTILDNYRVWLGKESGFESHSSTLYDTVAVYLAIKCDLCRMERLRIRVTDDGMTTIDPAGTPMNVATSWKDLDGFRDWMVGRLTSR